MLRTTFICAAVAMLGMGCSEGPDVGEPGDVIEETPEETPDPSPDPDPDPDPEPTPITESGMIFTLGNEADGNAVLAYARGADGQLDPLGTFPTGGFGSGGGLGSQSSLVASADGKYLYVVNAGSNDISAFEVFDDHLSLISITDSGGLRPVSLTLRENRLYVVNAEDSSVAGFAVEDGWLVAIAGAARNLSRTDAPTGPAQIGLNPRGDVLVVTEKATNSITTYRVGLSGGLSEPIVTESEGMTPFGFDFSGDSLVVSEAFGGADDASAASSYQVNINGSLSVIGDSSSVPSFQSAACWVVVSGNVGYTTNTRSNTVSAYLLDGNDALTLAPEAGGVVANLGEGRRPIDMVTAVGEYLYVLNAGTDDIVGFKIESPGVLTNIDNDLAMPNAVGLLSIVR